MPDGKLNSLLKILIFYFVLINLKTNSVEYEPTWESLDQRPLPDWYDDAKVGLMIHWGPHSVPSFADEWFYMRWKEYKTSEYVEFMTKHYGPHITYEDIENEFTAELFDGKEWALLFQDSGAKYVIFTSKHHDGYTLWPSSFSPVWNSVAKRPKRDLVGEFCNGIRTHTSLRIGLHYILQEPFNPMYLADVTNSKQTFVTTRIYPEMKELITTYEPDVFWINGGYSKPETYWKTKEFLVWLYNESPVKNHIVSSDRWSSDTYTYGSHGDIQTYSPHEKLKWENPIQTDKTTWSFRAKSKLIDYRSSKEIIHELIKTIGRGGNFVLNIGPTRFGNFAPIYEERLREMGKWLENNGEAIYSRKNVLPYDTSENEEIWYTTEKIASTENRIIVYAIFLNYPYDTKTLDLRHLANRTDIATTISILGLPNTQLRWNDNSDVLRVNIPEKTVLDKIGLDHAWTLKITLPTANRKMVIISL